MKTKAKVTYTLRKDDSAHTLDADIVLVATGRRPYTDGLGLAELGVEMTDRGQVAIDDHWRTNIEGIYALGDADRRPDARPQGRGRGHGRGRDHRGPARPRELRRDPRRDLHRPRGRQRRPDRGTAQGRGPRLQGRQVLLHGQRRAKAHVHGRRLRQDCWPTRRPTASSAAHIIGPMAGDLIHEVCVAMEFGASAEDLARTCHAHPTFSEAVREAALACGDGAIHA